MTDDERNTRTALTWAIGATQFRLPPSLREPGGWRWDKRDLSLYAINDDGEFRFHVAAKRLRSRKVRIAVMTIEDDRGKATWESDMPDEHGHLAESA